MNLLVLAAGMGSRFGGLKQLEPVGPSGEIILDYSIHDAIEAGFTKVVFVIKKENLDAFEETIGKRIKKHIKVEYAFQSVLDTPIKVDIKREKPWGTVQAILCAKDKIDDSFAVINADDFYGKDAFKKAYHELKKLDKDNKYSAVLYEAKATLSENGAVKRGVCKVKDNKVLEIIESSVEEKSGKLVCKPLENKEEFITDLSSLVSMNLYLFNKSIFSILETEFKKFLENKNNWEEGECLITTVINDKIKEKEVELSYVSTHDLWIGMTYKSDLEAVKEKIAKLIESKEYQESLWR